MSDLDEEQTVAKLRLLHGADDVREALKSGEELDVFRYQLNKPSFMLALVVGGVLLGLGGMLWWDTGLASASSIAVFVAICAVGLGLGVWVAYWYAYTQTHFVAVSDNELFIGERERMWAVDHDLLDRESLGFEDMNISKIGGSMDMDVGGQELRVRLFNAFIHLDDIQGFILRLLQHLKGDFDAGEAMETPPDDLDSPTEETTTQPSGNVSG